MRVAVIGSRDFPDLDRVDRFVEQLEAGTIVVSGGARGVDYAADQAALRNGLGFEVHKAEWDKEGKIAGKLRNYRIVKRADRVVAFWDGMSTGTSHAVTVAVALGVPVQVILP